MTFTETGHCITDGQPWHGISYDGVFNMTVDCGRKGSSGPSQWFLNAVGNGVYISAIDSVNNNDVYSGVSIPDKANFAFTGEVNIDGKVYEICVAQACIDACNVWFVGGPDFTTDGWDAIPIVTSDFKYGINPGMDDTSYHFEIF